jgi:hypothetical protein
LPMLSQLTKEFPDFLFEDIRIRCLLCVTKTGVTKIALSTFFISSRLTKSPSMISLLPTQSFSKVTRDERAAMRRAIESWNVAATGSRDGVPNVDIFKQEHDRRARMRAHVDRRRIVATIPSCKSSSKWPSQTVREEVNVETRRRAEVCLEEALADAREMSSMVLFSVCMATRDRQCNEKKQRFEHERKERRQFDEAMERERMAAIRMQMEREAEQKCAMKLSAEALREQIAERLLERRNMQSIRDIEAKKTLHEIECSKALEEAERVDKRNRVKALLADINAANASQIARKAEIERANREEEERAMTFILKKEARDSLLAEEEEKYRKLREIETARLRSFQEKQKDERAEQDEIRARKLQDAYERKQTLLQEEKESTKRRVLEEIAVVRILQHEEKMQIQDTKLKMELEEAKRIIMENEIVKEKEKLRDVERHSAAIAYKLELRQQMDCNAKAKERERVKSAAEAEAERVRFERDLETVERIKARKLREIKCKAIPKKYMAELERKMVRNIN